MLRFDKILWEEIIKLISFGTTEEWSSEMNMEDITDEELRLIARDVLDPNKLPHSGDDIFDIWNTYVEGVLPTKFLDAVEEKIDEDRACDIEDYFFYIQKRSIYSNLFNFWIYVFSEYLSKNDSIIINEDFTDKVKNYIKYVDDLTDKVNNFEISDPWDLLIDSLYVPNFDEDEAPQEINYSYIKELINKFAFIDISYDFWQEINELNLIDFEELKEWAVQNYGDETEPLVPVIEENPEDEEEDE